MASWMAEDLSPAEWAAHHSHDVLVFSDHTSRFADRSLDRSVQEFAKILVDPAAIEAARRRYLTDEERAYVEERARTAWGDWPADLPTPTFNGQAPSTKWR